MMTSPTKLSRKDSRYSVNYKNYQECLLQHLKDENLSEFIKLLADKEKYNINPDHVYGGTCNKTCLAEASKGGLIEFIEALLNSGADPNVVCHFHFGNAAVHFAAAEGLIDAIKCLVGHPRTDRNAINRRGETFLHLLASDLTKKGENAEQYFWDLACQKETNVTHRNEEGQSVISVALSNCSGYICREVLQRRDLRREDRDLILENHPEFKEDKSESIEPIYTHDDAYMDLIKDELVKFKDKFRKEFVNRTDLIQTTFLQLACKKGYPDIVKLLLDHGADVNMTGKHEDKTPVYLACYYGQYDITKLLFETNAVDLELVGGKSLLHAVLEGLSRNHPVDTAGHHRCFDYLLEENSKLQIPINHCDTYGHTALHYAAVMKDNHYAVELLNNGAYLGSLNDFGFSPLNDIGPKALEEILDNCVECTNGRKDNQYTLKFNFNILKPNESCDMSEQMEDAESGERLQNRLPEMLPLFHISRSKKFEHLLKHPVLLTFLHLKWTRICILFYINMICFITFVIFLTAHVLSKKNVSEECDGNSKPVEFRTILIVLTVVLVFRELVQIWLLPKKLSYLCNLDNILEVCIIATTILILIGIRSKTLVSVTLLLAWMEVVLQLGCIYNLAVYNEMMKRVTFNYLKFLLWSSPLIFSFSISFYMLYHNNPPEGNVGNFSVNSIKGNFSYKENKSDFYANITTSLLKTVVMMIGELEASDMSFEGGSYFLFLFFVFMMVIVLMNLLNGLAVSDTQAIKNDAELVACKLKVKLVYQFERVVFGGSLNNRSMFQRTRDLASFCCPWQGTLRKKISLFPDVLKDGYLEVVLDHGTSYINIKAEKMKIKEKSRPDTCFRIGKYWMGIAVDREALIAAKDIWDKRKKQSLLENTQIMNRIGKVEEGLQECMKQLANMEELLKQLINKK